MKLTDAPASYIRKAEAPSHEGVRENPEKHRPNETDRKHKIRMTIYKNETSNHKSAKIQFPFEKS